MTPPSDVADHAWAIDEREYARHEARRGRRHAFERLDPRRTALVVVDIVPFFVRESAYVRGIVPRVNMLAAALGSAGGTVAWVVPGYVAPSAKDARLGTVTNVCVEDTVRGASAAGLRVILVADACAATRDRDHNATLHVVYRSYGDVRSTAEVVALITAGTSSSTISRST